MAISLGVSLGTALTAAAITAATAGGIVGGISSIAEHRQAQANADAQAKQAEYNKRLEEREAARVEAETAENVRRQREQANELKAQQRALLGKSGAAMTSGTPLAILGITAADEELRAQDMHTAGYQQADNHREAAKMYQYQAGVARAQAPTGGSLALSLVGNAFGTAGKLAQIGGNYAYTKASLSKSTWNSSLF